MGDVGINSKRDVVCTYKPLVTLIEDFDKCVSYASVFECVRVQRKSRSNKKDLFKKGRNKKNLED